MDIWPHGPEMTSTYDKIRIMGVLVIESLLHFACYAITVIQIQSFIVSPSFIVANTLCQIAVRVSVL